MTPEFLRLETGLKLRGSLISNVALKPADLHAGSSNTKPRDSARQMRTFSKFWSTHPIAFYTPPKLLGVCLFSPFHFSSSPPISARCTFLGLDIDKLPQRRRRFRPPFPAYPVPRVRGDLARTNRGVNQEIIEPPTPRELGDFFYCRS